MNYTKIEKEIEKEIGPATTKIIARLLEKAYNAGYMDAAEQYHSAIDIMGIRDIWDLSGRNK